MAPACFSSPGLGWQEDSECYECCGLLHGSIGLLAPLVCLVVPQSQRPFILLGWGRTPWLSMGCGQAHQRYAAGKLAARLLWAWARGPCFFACQFLTSTGNECSGNVGVEARGVAPAFWHPEGLCTLLPATTSQPGPGGQHWTLRYTPQGDSDLGSTGSYIR